MAHYYAVPLGHDSREVPHSRYLVLETRIRVPETNPGTILRSAEVLDCHQIAPRGSVMSEQKCLPVRGNRKTHAHSRFDGVEDAAFDRADDAGTASGELVKADIGSCQSVGIGVEIIDAIVEHRKSSSCHPLHDPLFLAATQGPGKQRP